MIQTTVAKPIFVLQTAFVGDVILTFPLLKQIKKDFPNHPLWVGVRPPLHEFVLASGMADHAIGLDKSDSKSWRESTAQLRQMQFFKVFSPHQSMRSALLVRSLAAEEKVGYHKWWNFWAFHRRVHRPMEKHEVLRMLALLKSTDFALWDGPIAEIDKTKFDLNVTHYITQSIPDAATSLIPRLQHVSLADNLPTDLVEFVKQCHSKFVCIAPGSVWPTKRWTESGFVELGVQLLNAGYGIVWIGSKAENSLCERLMNLVQKTQSQVSQESQQKVAAGHLTLIQTALLMKNSLCVVANDSGGMHLAAAAGVPVVGIFGPTAPQLGFLPWTPKSRIAQTNLGCRPCGTHGHKSCPIGTHDCMKQLNAAKVFSLLQELIAR